MVSGVVMHVGLVGVSIEAGDIVGGGDVFARSAVRSASEDEAAACGDACGVAEDAAGERLGLNGLNVSAAASKGSLLDGIEGGWEAGAGGHSHRGGCIPRSRGYAQGNSFLPDVCDFYFFC